MWEARGGGPWDIGCASIGGTEEAKDEGARFESAGGRFDSSESSRLIREAISTVMVVRDARPDAGLLRLLFETPRKLMGTVDE